MSEGKIKSFVQYCLCNTGISVESMKNNRYASLLQQIETLFIGTHAMYYQGFTEFIGKLNLRRKIMHLQSPFGATQPVQSALPYSQYRITLQPCLQAFPCLRSVCQVPRMQAHAEIGVPGIRLLLKVAIHIQYSILLPGLMRMHVDIAPHTQQKYKFGSVRRM